MPYLQEIYDLRAAHGLVVLGVNTTYIDNRKDYLDFIAELVLSFPVVFDESGEVSQRLFTIYGLPTTAWIDREGILRQVIIGAMSAEMVVELADQFLMLYDRFLVTEILKHLPDRESGKIAYRQPVQWRF